jgi:alpha-N-acetylglucosaminidase
MMDLEDTLLESNRYFLVGPWLSAVSPWADNETELRQLQYDARSILTTWGDRGPSEFGLHDYANKDWAGLTRDYYRPRWQLYFDGLDHSLSTGSPPKPIDWFAVGEAWNRQLTPYPGQASGDTYSIAAQVARELGLERQTPAP